ncbi:hypothetical protein [uncultured Nostoc sp.]|uniref:phage head spike fiber domain-containing protein n=1 Tax=uncultured Nostoc sp. TaxID=340711 RepID=UPI0035CC515B
MPLYRKQTVTQSSLILPSTVKTTAKDSDFFIGIDENNQFYKISKSDLFAGMTSGTGTGTGTTSQNLITYSEEFSNSSAWSSENVSITPNVAVAPDGTMTADQVTFNSNTAKIYRLFGKAATVVSGEVYTHSVYLKTQSGTFNLKLARTNQATWLTAKISSEFTVTNTWQRFQYSYTVPAGETISDFVIGDEDLTGYALPATGTINIWGAQINQGNTARAYSKTLDTIIP